MRLIWMLALPLVSACAGSFQPDFDVASSGSPAIGAMGIEELNLFVYAPEAVQGIPVLLDTGAPFSFLNPALMPGARQEGDHMSALTIGGVTFHDFFNELGTGLPLLGADVFGKFATRFDYRDKEIRFAPSEPPAGVAPPIERAFELEGGGETKTSFGVRYFAATRIFVSVEVEGRALTLLLDTGADVVYLRRQTFDALVGDGRKTLSITAAAAGGAVDTEVARTSSVRVYGEEVSDAFISYVDEGRIDELAKEAGRPVDGLLGAAFLRHFAIDIDYPRRTLALHRYLDDSQLVDPYARVGIELRGSSSVHPYEIATVYAGTDAASKGLKPGDVLLTIDELDLDQANLDPFAAMRALRGPIGTLHQLTTTTGVFSVAVDQLL